MPNDECRVSNDNGAERSCEPRGLSPRKESRVALHSYSLSARGRSFSNRRGISLLEALFAIFVAAIGILSLAALIPVGKFMVGQAERSDRGSAVAEAAMQELINRGLVQTSAATGSPNMIVLDPWFLSRQPDPTLPEVTSFPFDSSSTSPNYYGTGTPPRLTRVTVLPGFVGLVATPALHREAADRVFTSHDDQTFTEAARPEDRPQVLFTGGATSSYLGDYSWLATITPAQSQRYQAPLVNGLPIGRTMFSVQVAVFQKRIGLPPADNRDRTPSERIVLADLIGGGDVRLRATDAADLAFLKLRTNQWVMLVGFTATGGAVDSTGAYLDAPLATPAGTGLNRPVVGWYRVVATGDAEREQVGGTWYKVRYVTLAGPDLGNPTFTPCDTDGDGVGDITYDADSDNATGFTLHAYLLTDCVAVQERTIKLDVSAMNGY